MSVADIRTFNNLNPQCDTYSWRPACRTRPTQVIAEHSMRRSGLAWAITWAIMSCLNTHRVITSAMLRWNSSRWSSRCRTDYLRAAKRIIAIPNYIVKSLPDCGPLTSTALGPSQNQYTLAWARLPSGGWQYQLRSAASLASRYRIASGAQLAP